MPNSKFFLCHISMHLLLLRLKGCPPVFLSYYFFSIGLGQRDSCHACTYRYTAISFVQAALLLPQLSAMSLFSGQQASVLCLLFVSVVYKGIALPM
uniref:Uncharacterized protein n=1 Tax=Rhipicephalus appendiculatus TaxID=34631 RepID=A0A131YDY1_RHIAP